MIENDDQTQNYSFSWSPGARIVWIWARYLTPEARNIIDICEVCEGLASVVSTVRQGQEHEKAATERFAHDRSYRPRFGRALRSCVVRADLN